MEIPRRLEQITLSCLEKNPNQRPPSAAELVRMLAACIVEEAWSNQRAERWWRTHAPSWAGYRAAQPETRLM